MAEGAPLLREYGVYSPIEGSNPSDSAKPPVLDVSQRPPLITSSPVNRGFFVSRPAMACLDSPQDLGDLLGDFFGEPEPDLQKVPQMPSTEMLCKCATCPAGRPRARLADAGGLYLEVQPSGGKHWRWKYRFGGKEKRLALGTYPDVSLAKARLARESARLTLSEGIDPVQAMTDAKQANRQRQGTNVESVARAWFEHWKGPRSPRHADYVLRRLEADVFPAVGRKPISEVSAPQMLAMANASRAAAPSTSPSAHCRPAARSCVTPWPMACWSATRPPNGASRPSA